MLSSRRRTPAKRPSVTEQLGSQQTARSIVSNRKEEPVRNTSSRKEKQRPQEVNQSQQSLKSKEQSLASDGFNINPLNSEVADTLTPSENGKNLMEAAIAAFRRNLPSNEMFIDCSCVGAIFIELFKDLKIKVADKAVWKLIQEITDFIPRKLTEQSFLDLFALPQTKEFLTEFKINANMEYTIPRLSDIFPNNSQQIYDMIPDRSFTTDIKSSTLHSLSPITDNPLLLNTEKQSSKSNQSRSSVGNSSKNLLRDRASKSRLSIDSKPSNISGSGTDSSYQTINESMLKKALYGHSLITDSSLTNKSSLTGESNNDYGAVQWDELYGKDLANLFGQLLPYSVTPPRPIFGKETQMTILKELVLPSSEYTLLSSLLGKFLSK